MTFKFISDKEITNLSFEEVGEYWDNLDDFYTHQKHIVEACYIEKYREMKEKENQEE